MIGRASKDYLSVVDADHTGLVTEHTEGTAIEERAAEDEALRVAAKLVDDRPFLAKGR